MRRISIGLARPPLHHHGLLAALLLVGMLVSGPGLATGAQAKPLGHEAYEIWRGIEDEALSPDGRWLLYSLSLENGDPELVVRSLSDDTEHRIARGSGARFDAAGTHVVMLIRPPMGETRRARLDDIEPDERPKAALGILDLVTGELTELERVSSFRIGAKGGDRVAYRLEKPLAAAEADGEETAEAQAEQEDAQQTDAADDSMPEGTELVVRDLGSGEEFRFAAVTSYTVAESGSRLAFATTLPEPGVKVLANDEKTPTAVIEGRGRYEGLTFDDTGERLAFLTDRDDFEAEAPEHALYLWRAGGTADLVVDSTTPGVPADWWVSTNAEISFSTSGSRLYFGTAPRPAPEPEEPELLDEEKVKLDIWHWQDPLLQPMQLLQADDERDRTYLAVVHTDIGAVVQLADDHLPDVTILDDGDGDLAHGRSALRYRKEISWEFPGFADHYLVDLASGGRQPLREKQPGQAHLSPDGRWIIWWSGQELAWYAKATDGGIATNVSATLRHPVHREDHDWPYDPQPYGLAGWARTPEGSVGSGVEALVYDRYDLWALDPSGEAAPRHVTSGAGRDARTRLRRIDLDDEAEWVEESEILLSSFAETTKDAGFWRVGRFDPLPPRILFQAPYRFGRRTKADAADVLLFTRESVTDFPDLWVSGPDIADARRISEANSQQADYLWTTAELTRWRSTDGELLQGLIHKPADFDPSRRYPMMVTFYERNSDNLHLHHPPTPHRSVIRQTFYASRGYVVFTPDITYEVGYPGESALEDVVSGVLHMIGQGYVDARNIGAQGHSWGGYQIAYMVTKTDIFKAAAGGAPVSNMTSAYGGIRWGSGMSRMFQYERTQSRLGGTLWEMPLRYLENSPIFWADKVDTPLMMMHNDHDGAVPWYQGIEMFVALRRLGKPAWLINYNDEPHWPTTHANKVDWNIRMQQFFDHFLKGEPAPRWLAEGIPAIEKGTTLGLELLDTDARDRR